MHIYKDRHYRSILKALSWRVLATLATILIVFAFTKKLVLSLGVGVVEVVIKLILYYFHERMWGAVGFGKKTHPLSRLQLEKELDEKDYVIIRKKLQELGYIEEG